MSEDDTYRKLRRIPLQDMIENYESIRSKLAPVYSAANITFESYAIRLRSLEIHILRDRALRDGGWTIEEFFAAIEKEAIIEEIAKLNATIQFPQEIIDRVREVFPNMVFTQANISL